MSMDESSVYDDWDELSTDFKELEVANRVYQDKLQEIDAYQKNCEKHLSHQKYRLSIISKTLNKLKKKSGDDAKVKELENHIIKRKLQLGNIEQCLPKENGIYLKIILGNVNVSILNKESKFKYKDEYEKFKLVLSIIGFVMAVLNLSMQFRALELSYIFLLVWYYCTLTIRESILKINGSRIQGWWRFHHFVSTVAAGILLIWPDNRPWSMFRNQFMWFNTYISVVQYLQFRYQRGVLYRLKALGERHNMDITIEGFHSWMWKGISFLLPVLFGGYLFQLYNSYTLFTLISDPESTWHVPVLCLIFLLLFFGNFVTTIIVIHSKVQRNIKLKYQLISQKLSSQFLMHDNEDKDKTNKED